MISETNYEDLTLRWESLKENDFVVYLKSKDNKLDEIVLSKENPQSILQKIVIGISLDSFAKDYTNYMAFVVRQCMLSGFAWQQKHSCQRSLWSWLGLCMPRSSYQG